MVMAMAALMAVDNVPVAVLVLGLFANEAKEAIDKQAQENPNDIEHDCCFEDIKDGRPQL